MTFEPIVAVWGLVLVAVALTLVRMVALYRILTRTWPGRYRAVVLRWSGLTLAVLLLVVAAARPSLSSDDNVPPPEPPAASLANLNVFFVVDRSVAERVEDYGDGRSRMAGIRDDIGALIDQYPRARFALIGFSANAALEWPLSDDVWSLRPRVEGLSPYTDVPADAVFAVDGGAAREVLLAKLTEALADYPGSRNVVFYLGSGAAGSRAPQTAFDDEVAESIAGGAVLGYGTDTGGPVPERFVDGGLLYFTDQRTGEPLRSAIDEQRLDAVADDLGVTYLRRTDGQPIGPAIPAVEPAEAPESERLVATRTVERAELYWLFTALAGVLLLVEVFLIVRDVRRTHLAQRDVIV